MAREISSLSRQTQLLDAKRLIGKGESHGILIVDLGILNIEANVSQVAVKRPLSWLEQRTTHVERAGNGGVPGNPPAKIGAQEWVQVDAIHAQRQGVRAAGVPIYLAVP